MMKTTSDLAVAVRFAILLAFFALKLDATFLAQTARTVVENDQVKVLSVDVAPHQKTRLHDHKVNRVMIYLQPGMQKIDYQDGKKAILNWKAGEAKWSPASGMHVAEITSEQLLSMSDQELYGLLTQLGITLPVVNGVPAWSRDKMLDVIMKVAISARDG